MIIKKKTVKAKVKKSVSPQVKGKCTVRPIKAAKKQVKPKKIVDNPVKQVWYKGELWNIELSFDVTNNYLVLSRPGHGGSNDFAPAESYFRSQSSYSDDSVPCIIPRLTGETVTHSRKHWIVVIANVREEVVVPDSAEARRLHQDIRTLKGKVMRREEELEWLWRDSFGLGGTLCSSQDDVTSNLTVSLPLTDDSSRVQDEITSAAKASELGRLLRVALYHMKHTVSCEIIPRCTCPVGEIREALEVLETPVLDQE